MQKEWVCRLEISAGNSDVPFFFKQWGGVRKAKNGRLLDDRTYDEYAERIAAAVPERAVCAAFAQDILSSFA